MDAVKIKKVIITTLSRKGRGVQGDPIRVLTQIWDMDGNLITEIDEFEKEKPSFIEIKEASQRATDDEAEQILFQNGAKWLLNRVK